jgi:hypothetical protein
VNYIYSWRYRLQRMMLLSGALLAACTSAGDALAPDIEGTVLAQLARSSDTLAAKGLPIRIVGYTAAGSLDSEDAVRLVKADILDDNALVPQYDGVNAVSLRLHSIRDRMQAFQAGEDSQDVVENLESVVLSEIHAGQKVLDVMWEGESGSFETKLVYDQNGVVYDNLLSNIALVEDAEVAQDLPPSSSAGVNTEGAVALVNQSFSTRVVDRTIAWIWGGTRGKIEIDHYVISCNNWVSFCDDGGQATAWMTLGSARARSARNALRYPRISKLAWGYGWATPTASFSISFNSKNLTFSVTTGGVGSAGKGAGIHTIF